MVTYSESRESSNFRKVSKPLMEKKRRARINVSLEQLKTLLEKNYSQNIRKRKLEKADILELTVKYLKTLQNSVQGAPVFRSSDYQAGFRNCLNSVNQFLLKSEDCGGHPVQSLVLAAPCFSTKDSTYNSSSVSPTSPSDQEPPAHVSYSNTWTQQPNKAMSPSHESSLFSTKQSPLSTGHSPVTLSSSRCPVQNVWRPW